MSDEKLPSNFSKKAAADLYNEIRGRVHPLMQKAWTNHAPDEAVLPQPGKPVNHISDSELATIQATADKVIAQSPLVGEAEKQRQAALLNLKIERHNFDSSTLNTLGIFYKKIDPLDAEKQLKFAAKGANAAQRETLGTVLERLREDLLAAQSDGDVRVSDAETRAMYDKALGTLQDAHMPDSVLNRVKQLVPHLAAKVNIDNAQKEYDITNEAAYRETQQKSGKGEKVEKGGK